MSGTIHGLRHWMGSACAIMAYWAVWVLPQHLTLAQTGGNDTVIDPINNDTIVDGNNDTIVECWDNTTALFEQLLRDNFFEERTYVLCPNTDFVVGRFRIDGTCCDDGDRYLSAAPRTTYKCGEDGKSTNNCTFIGGNLQLTGSAAMFNEPALPDAVIMGVTFRSSEAFQGSLSSRGDITFIDCIWEDNNGFAQIVAAYAPMENPIEDGRRLSLEEKLLMQHSDHLDRDDPMTMAELLMSPQFQSELLRASTEEGQRIIAEIAENPEKEVAHRELQADFLQRVTFQNCIFRGNRQGPLSPGGVPILGIVTIPLPFNPVIFEDCLFENNIFDGSDGSSNGYAVQSVGSSVEMRDTCFEGNSFIGFGPVQLWAGAPFVKEGTYASEDDLIFCNFAATSDLPVPDEFDDTTCIGADLISCGGPPLPDTLPPNSDPPTSAATSSSSVFTIVSALFATALLSIPVVSSLV